MDRRRSYWLKEPWLSSTSKAWARGVFFLSLWENLGDTRLFPWLSMFFPWKYGYKNGRSGGCSHQFNENCRCRSVVSFHLFVAYPWLIRHGWDRFIYALRTFMYFWKSMTWLWSDALKRGDVSFISFISPIDSRDPTPSHYSELDQLSIT